MSSHHRVRSALVAAAIAVGCAAPAFSDAMLARPHNQGGITYVTGGIGDNERSALEASARNYDLQITNSERTGAFMAGIDLVIQARGGQDVLRVRNTGPLFYAQLPPGEYVIHATYQGAERLKDAKIAGRGATDIHMIWPGQD